MTFRSWRCYVDLPLHSCVAVCLLGLASAGPATGEDSRTRAEATSAEGAGTSPAGSPGPTNRIMGTGEPRDPQPFTRAQRLLEAARKGDRATIERALELGVPVDSVDDLNRSALLLAARDAGDLDLVRFLHDRGGAIDRADAGGRTPLSFAAGAGRLDLVRYFVDEGAELDSADRRGRTPLFQAVLADQLDTVAFLIEQGAQVDPRDRFRDTPLMMACAKGQAEMARLLRRHGADPNARDQEGRSPGDRAPTLDACLADESA